MIDLDATVVASQNQIFSDLGGEVVILQLRSEEYFGLEGAGALVWILIQSPRPVLELRDAILAEFDVPLERCEQDLLELLDSLAARGLVEIQDAPAA